MSKRLLCIMIILVTVFLSGCVSKSEVKKYKVSFSFEDQSISDLEIEDGKLLSFELLPIPNAKDGYVFDGWYLDDLYEVEYSVVSITADIVLYGRFIVDEDLKVVEALQTIKIPTETYDSISLPLRVEGYDLIWSSNNPTTLNHNGVVNNPDKPTLVIITVKVKNRESIFRQFDVSVLPFPYEEVFNEIKSIINLPGTIEKDISLPTTFPHNVKGIWESNKPEVITNNGVVKLTDNIETVSLKLTLTVYNESIELTFEVTTIKKQLTINDYEYFVQSAYDNGYNQNVIMTPSEIQSFNETVLNSPKTKTVDLTSLPLSISKLNLQTMINSYSNIDKYSIYNDVTKAIVSPVQKNDILNNRNLESISEVVQAKYAVSSTFTLLRSYPTMYYSNNYEMDRFQETGFCIGVPMMVYHTSTDGNWYFVQMYNYYGWVMASSVGLCSRDEFMSYANPDKFIVALSSTIEIKGQFLRMGYRLPFAFKTEESYKVLVPTRNETGNLVNEEVEVLNDGNISDGYIPYTYNNLLNQSFKLIGIKYSWGDKVYNKFDCSSTQAAIYACFGFVMGRNTSNQWTTEVYGKTIDSISNLELKKYQPGTLLYTSGHVLMYIGIDSNGNCWLLHNTSTGYICKIQTLNDYGTSSIKHVLELKVIS